MNSKENMIIWYDGILNNKQLGWKITNLLKIRNYFNIPRWFIITDLNDLNKGNIEKVYKEYINAKFYICRSSMSKEDSYNISYAWLFESVEGNIENWWLEEDIKEVFNSINNDFLDEYERKVIWTVIKNRKIAVLIQEFIIWDVSWVYFSNYHWKKIINYVKWCNQFLVENIVQPNKIILDHKFNVLSHIKVKQYKYIWNNLDVFIYDKVNNSLTNKNLKNLLITLEKLEKYFNFDIDVERTIKNDKIYILQIRPITINKNGFKDS